MKIGESTNEQMGGMWLRIVLARGLGRTSGSNPHSHRQIGHHFADETGTASYSFQILQLSDNHFSVDTIIIWASGVFFEDSVHSLFRISYLFWPFYVTDAHWMGGG